MCSADWKPLSRCATAPPSGSKRFRKLCGLPRNFTALPKPPSMREVASRSDDGRSPYPNYSFSRTSCDSSLKEGASGETRKLCGLPGNFTALPKPPSMREVASRSDDGRSSYTNHSFSRTPCDSSPKWEQAHPQALRSTRKFYRTAKGSPFGRAGKPDRA